jgi:hypothetical protein
MLYKKVGQVFTGLVGEERGMGIFQLVQLRLDGGNDLGVAVPQARHRRAPRRIDVRAPVRIDQSNTLPAHGAVQCDCGVPMKDMCHDSYSYAEIMPLLPIEPIEYGPGYEADYETSVSYIIIHETIGSNQLLIFPFPQLSIH